MDCDITKQAQEYASDMAGEYLTELNKTDLIKMTRAEWMELINVITKNYHLKHIEISIKEIENDIQT